MDLRNRRGGITPAEGCMFAAVGLFVILLIAMVIFAYIRFQDRPRSAAPPGPAALIEVEAAPAEVKIAGWLGHVVGSLA